MVRPHGQGGVEPMRTFFGQGGRGKFFAILCGYLLWTSPNLNYSETILTRIN